jgi:hypothetical protein
MTNQLPENTHPKVTHNWLYFFPAFILAILAISVLPIWSFATGVLFRNMENILAAGLALLPPIGVLIGTAVAYYLASQKLKFHIWVILGGLAATFITCLIVGPQSGTPPQQVILVLIVEFIMLSIPAWAMWGAVAFFRTFRGDK